MMYSVPSSLLTAVVSIPATSLPALGSVIAMQVRAFAVSVFLEGWGVSFMGTYLPRQQRGDKALLEFLTAVFKNRWYAKGHSCCEGGPRPS